MLVVNCQWRQETGDRKISDCKLHITMDKNIQVIETGDGSHSLLNVALDETYHSRHGALQESEYVFIEKGLYYWMSRHSRESHVRILEVGMGTGLNVILTVREAMQHTGLHFNFTTLEPYPLREKTVEQLNYLRFLPKIYAIQAKFRELHACDWEKEYPLLDNFTLLKLKQKLEDMAARPSHFDLIYFDAFAPNKQAELWTAEVLEKVASMMKPGAIFVTYSAKGQLKRDLRALGLEVETLPGPPGKAEMVRASRL